MRNWARGDCSESWEDSLSHVLAGLGRGKPCRWIRFRGWRTASSNGTSRGSPVQPFRTHLPLYSLRAAAGKFGADEEVEAEEEDWVRAPEGLRLTEGMFVAHVEGRSMEPRIPDGSLNIFRGPVVGSRQGKIVLVELIGRARKVHRETVHQREIAPAGEDEWRHERIRLEPLNPEYEAFDLSPDQIKYVIAEWIQTLE